MNYELAKQLKDAGFPDKYTKDCKCLPVLSLSNLIEACGENFAGLGRNKFKKEIRWLASQNIDKFGNWLGLYGHGSTPEEAVAKLWLALKVATPTNQ